MYLDKITSIFNFDDKVIRNTPLFAIEEDALSDLVDGQFDIDVAKKTIHTSDADYLNKIEYHAVDYIFKRTTHFQSRFSDGSYPIWYASNDLETTYYETAIHWKKTILDDIYYEENKPIIIHRSIFTVGCHAMLIDLRTSLSLIPELTDPNINAYKTTQTLSKELYSQGQAGLYTPSARKKGGENVAIYTKKSLSSVEHLKDVSYEYDIEKSRLYVTESSLPSSKKITIKL